MQNRETFYSALFTRLQALAGINGIVTVDRRLKHWNDVPPESQGYIGMAQVNESGDYAAGRTEQWHLRCVLYLYIHEADDTLSPAPKLNTAMDAVNSIFTPDNHNVNTCTFGGLVHYARIEGTVETDEGTLGSQAVARIPVEMLVVG